MNLDCPTCHRLRCDCGLIEYVTPLTDEQEAEVLARRARSRSALIAALRAAAGDVDRDLTLGMACTLLRQAADALSADRGGFDELRAALSELVSDWRYYVQSSVGEGDSSTMYRQVLRRCADELDAALAAHPATGDGRDWFCAFNMGDVPACTPTDPHGGNACRFATRTPPPATGERAGE